jgi:chemotaxis response regulator CheB
MPKAPVESGLADMVLPLNKIAEKIVKTIKRV